MRALSLLVVVAGFLVGCTQDNDSAGSGSASQDSADSASQDSADSASQDSADSASQDSADSASQDSADSASQDSSDSDSQQSTLVCEQTDAEFFSERVWPALTQCLACHQPGGNAPQGGARLVLSPGDEAASLDAVRTYVPVGGDLLVKKPTGQVTHSGGRFFDPDSDKASALADAVLRFGPDAPQCTGDDTVKSEEPGYSDVTLISQTRTLRKASLLLNGELPDTAALNSVQADDAALKAELRSLMTGPVFESWLKNSANDHLLARKYLTGMTGAQEALGLQYYEALNERTFRATTAENKARQECQDSGGDDNSPECVRADNLRKISHTVFRETRRALAEEPLELITYVVTSDKPYTEVLTADYRMMNPFTYEVLDGETWTRPYDDMDANDWRPGQVRRYRVAWNTSLSDATGRSELPSAGILSSPIFQLRFPSTETNRNRARARWTYKFFLGVDIERLAVRAMDPEELQNVTDPGAEGSSCFGCHSIMDPVAGAFQNWGDDGHYLERRGLDSLPQTYVDSDEYEESDRWYRGQLAPGFGGEAMPVLAPYGPVNGYDDGLAWLAERIVADPRFAEGTVKFWFRGVFGRDPLLQPLESSDADFSDRTLAWQAEQTLIDEWADTFRNSNYDLKALLVEMMMSPLFRAETFLVADSGRQAALDTMGVGRLLSPEQLDRKFTATTGYVWKLSWQNDTQLLENYYMFYGGIDSDGITERPGNLNALMTSVSMRLANEMACTMVANEFWPGVNSTLFSGVSITTDPKTEAGEAAIRETLASLIWRFWGVTDETEVDAAWALYKGLYDQRMAIPEDSRPNYVDRTTRWSNALEGEEEVCPMPDLRPDDNITVKVDWSNIDWSGPETVRESLGSNYNPEQTLRPWVGVLVYLLTDIQFLTE